MSTPPRPGCFPAVEECTEASVRAASIDAASAAFEAVSASNVDAFVAATAAAQAAFATATAAARANLTAAEATAVGTYNAAANVALLSPYTRLEQRILSSKPMRVTKRPCSGGDGRRFAPMLTCSAHGKPGARRCRRCGNGEGL